MNIGIVFYSFSGNTQRVVKVLEQWLNQGGHQVATLRLKPLHEPVSFIAQSRQALSRKDIELSRFDFDLQACDRIIVASPVWAFAPAPALRTYLHVSSGLWGKKVSIVLTHGGGLGVGRALRETEKLLAAKKATVVFSRSIPGIKVKDEKYIINTLNGVLAVEAKHTNSASQKS